MTVGVPSPEGDDESAGQELDNASSTKLWRRRWVLGLVLVICLATVGVSWSLASPIGASPDDDFHLASIWCSTSAPSSECRTTTNTQPSGSRSVLVPIEVSPAILCFAFKPADSASCPLEPGSDRFVESRANDGLYPGGYYEVMGLFVSDHPVESALTMRLVGWLLATASIVAAALVSERRLRSAYVLAVITTSIPLGLFLFASNNPSGLAIAGVGAFWCASMAFMSAETKSRSWWSAGVAVLSGAMALISRGDAGLYIGAAAVSAFVFTHGWRRTLWRKSAFLAAAALTGLVGLVAASQVSIAADGLAATSTGRPLTSTLWYNINNLPALWTGSFGTDRSLGWLDTTMPAVVWAGVLALSCGLAFWALGMKRDGFNFAAIGILIATIVALPLMILSGSGNIVGENVQPRYLLPILPIILAYLLLATPDGAIRSLNNAQRNTYLIVATAAQSAALHANLRRYVTGQDVLGPDLSGGEWWWSRGPSPMTMWVLGSIAFAVGLLVALQLADRSTRSGLGLLATVRPE